jgi:hypothetical protein
MEADVTRNIEEQLSAFLDGELPEAELQLLVRRLEREQAYRVTLARYSEIGSILRNDPVVPHAAGFRAGVMRAISAEGIPVKSHVGAEQIESLLPARGKQRRVGTLLAAAVTVLAVLGIYQLDYFGRGILDDDEYVADSRDVPSALLTESTDTQLIYSVRRSAVNRDRMTSYLVSHGEFSRSLQGTMVDSRIFVQQASFE